MQSLPDETRSTRRTMRDLVALSTLPSIWVGRQPLQVAESLADLLLNTLRLDFVYLRLRAQADGYAQEVARTGQRPTAAGQAEEIGRALAPWLDSGDTSSAQFLPNPVGTGTLRVVRVLLGWEGENGILVAGSQQAGFPTEEDRLLLSVGANQATAVLHRLAAEQALRTSEERFRRYFELGLIGMAITSPTKGCLEVNDEICRILGYDRDELLTKTWAEMTHPDDLAADAAQFDRVMAGEIDEYSLEKRWVRKDGRVIHSTVSAMCLRLADGSVDYFVALLQDVTERRQAEEALRASERRFKGVFNQQFQFMAVLAPDGTVVEANDTCLRMTGLTRERVLGLQFWDTPWFNSLPHMQDLWRRGIGEVVGGRGPVTGEVEYTTADRPVRYATYAITGLKDDDGRVASVVVEGEGVEFTKRKLAEEALREGEERFRGTFENAAVGIAHVDAGCRFLRVNEQLCAIVGYTRAELLRRTCLDITHPEDLAANFEQFVPLMRGESPSYSLEKRYLRKDGSPVWVEMSVSLQRDAAGGSAYAIEVTEDISERKRLEGELRKAKETAEAANRAKDEFLANVSHEIRTPFGAILGMTELVLDTPLTEDQRQYLTTVKSAADSLLCVINDLLDFSKIEAGKLELDPADFSLRVALGDTLRALAVRANKKGLELACQIQPDVPDALVGDAGRLRQVLLNLVGNAIKFTEQGEVVIRVAGAGDSAPPGEIGLRFVVSDTGIGIPPDKQEKIFRAFEQEDTSTTRKYGGTGLGLTIAARLVALMGGEMTVESELARGSTFAFTARFGRQANPPEPSAGLPPVLLHDLPVLIVDDNATNRRILEEWLSAWRMKPLAVGDGLAALAALWHGAACGRPYELVLLDARMPDTDGLALAAQIRQRAELSATRIILLTSGDRPGDQARIRRLHIDAHLLKPVSQDELLEMINRVMSRADGDTLPVRQPAEAPAPAVAPLRILLAEDNEFNTRHLERLLGSRGHRVRLANNGREALALLGVGGRQSGINNRLSPDFDLMLLDLHMPELDGFQVVQAVREREHQAGGHLPVIALTARTREEDREKCLAAGMDDFLSKPVRAAELFAAIERVVSDQGVSRPARPTDGDRTSLLDPVVLLAASGGDGEGLGELCQDLRTYAPGRLAEVGDALRDQDAPRLREAAHKLCGLLSAFSTVAGNVASDLEDHAARGQIEKARRLVATLEAMAQELIQKVDGLSLESLQHQARPLDGPDWTAGA